MRVGFVSTFPPIECGIATYTQFLTEEILRQGKETFVISQIGAKGNNVVPVYWPDSVSIAALVFNASARITPDVMHIQHEFGIFGPHCGVQVVDLVLRYRMAGIPVVSTLHTVYPEPSKEEKLVLEILSEQSDALIVHEEDQKNILLDLFGKRMEKKTTVIPHGVREVTPVANAKKMLGLEGKKVVLLCGYFRENKLFHKIVEIWPEICDQVKDAVLVVAGKVRGLEYADYQAMLFDTVTRSPVADKIKVLRGQFPQKTFDTIISACDVGVMPYTVGAQSGVMSHFYAFHKPLVTSNLKAFADSLSRSGGGFACETDEEYIQRIVQLLKNDDLHAKMAGDIHNYLEKSCLWRKVVEQHFKVYDSVIQVPYAKAEYVYFG